MKDNCETDLIFKSYSRSFLRHLIRLRELLESGEIEEALKLIDSLIMDVEAGIED